MLVTTATIPSDVPAGSLATYHQPRQQLTKPDWSCMDTPAINQLPDTIANQIAAGEVIERPAAVVKELVENSIDAGSTHIIVRIAGGGQRLVEVIDNGHGMQEADLKQALGRHATSKLAMADDLFRIGTLGFRGEALPSIAAVSEFTLASRPANSDAGAKLDIAGGRELGISPEAMPVGTRVSVRNLFWNVPVRLKFLKQWHRTGHITDMVTRSASAILTLPSACFRRQNHSRPTTG